MKNSIFLLFSILLYFDTTYQTNTGTFITLSKETVKQLEKNYKWTSEDILIINYWLLPKNCHYDQYKGLRNSKNFFAPLYKKVDTHNTLNIFVYSDSLKAKNIIDHKMHYPDKSHFLLNSLFSGVNSCHGLLVINKVGYAFQKNGEYTSEEINKYVKALRPKN